MASHPSSPARSLGGSQRLVPVPDGAPAGDMPSTRAPSLAHGVSALAEARHEADAAIEMVAMLTDEVKALRAELAAEKQLSAQRGSLLETTLRQFTRVGGTLEPAVTGDGDDGDSQRPESQLDGDGDTKEDSKGDGGSGTAGHDSLPDGWEWRCDSTGEHWFCFHAHLYRSQWEKPKSSNVYWPPGISRDDLTAARLYHAVDSFACFPYNKDVLAFLVFMHAQAQLWVACMYYLDFLIESETDERWPLMKASCFRRLGLDDWALDSYESILAANPYSVEALRYVLSIRERLDMDVGDIPERLRAAQASGDDHQEGTDITGAQSPAVQGHGDAGELPTASGEDVSATNTQGEVPAEADADDER